MLFCVSVHVFATHFLFFSSLVCSYKSSVFFLNTRLWSTESESAFARDYLLSQVLHSKLLAWLLSLHSPGFAFVCCLTTGKEKRKANKKRLCEKPFRKANSWQIWTYIEAYLALCERIRTTSSLLILTHPRLFFIIFFRFFLPTFNLKRTLPVDLLLFAQHCTRLHTHAHTYTYTATGAHAWKQVYAQRNVNEVLLSAFTLEQCQ